MLERNRKEVAGRRYLHWLLSLTYNFGHYWAYLGPLLGISWAIILFSKALGHAGEHATKLFNSRKPGTWFAEVLTRFPMVVHILGRNCCMYYRQQNKYYPYRCLFAHFEATLDISRREFILAHNNISQICYRVLQLNAFFWQSDTFGGVTFILLAMVHSS